MAVPSRIFVGLTVFGLICTLLIVPVTVLVVSGVEPPPNLLNLGSKVEAFSLGQKVFLVIASLFSMAFTWLSWRALLAGARHAQKMRELAAANRLEREKGPPPGYI